MKFLLIADFGSDSRTGGGQTYSRSLLDLLINKNIDFDIVCYKYPCDNKDFFKKIESIIGIRKLFIIDIKTNFNIGIGTIITDLYAIFFILRNFYKFKFYNHFIYDQQNIIYYFFWRKTSSVMFHGATNFRSRGFRLINPRSSINNLWQKVFIRPIVKSFLNENYNKFPYFNSVDTLNKIASEYHLGESLRIHLNQKVIGLPIDTDFYKRNDFFRINTRSKLGLSNDDICVLNLSNFNSRMKRAYLAKPLIERYKNLHNVKFIFVGKGGGQYARELDQMVGKYNNFLRFFEVSPSEAIEWYSAADIAITFSEEDTFGYTVVEGMSCNLPTIVYDLCAHVEHINNGIDGFIAHDENDFYLKLDLLIRGSNLRKIMGENARSKIIKKYNGDVFIQNFLKFQCLN